MFDKMIEEYKTLDELREFAEAQSKTLLTQSQRIQQLQEEIVQLKGMLGATAGALDIPGMLNADEQETISRVQLSRLKDVSMQRELTLEEARKLEIYHKIIHQIENRPPRDVTPTKSMSTDSLLEALNEPASK